MFGVRLKDVKRPGTTTLAYLPVPSLKGENVSGHFQQDFKTFFLVHPLK
jgi:hypothetical protein